MSSSSRPRKGHGGESAEQIGEMADLVGIAREIGRPDSYAGKRNNIRFTVGERLDICTDPSTPATAMVAILHNINDEGAAFWLKAERVAGDRLFVRQFQANGEATWTPSIVRHCTRGINGYLVGVAFRD